MNKLKRRLSKKIVLGGVLCITGLTVVWLVMNLSLLLSTPKQYMITTENSFDYQPHYECSGYASAYVLRSLGENVNGLELYKSITTKNNDGTVSPDNLVKFLIEEGYLVNIHSGTTLQLKSEISKGTPVIVFVRTSPNENYYHYLPLVGYDEKNIYAAESLKYKENAKTDYYNRVIENSDFNSIWETGVFRKNTYITIKIDN